MNGYLNYSNNPRPATRGVFLCFLRMKKATTKNVVAYFNFTANFADLPGGFLILGSHQFLKDLEEFEADVIGRIL